MGRQLLNLYFLVSVFFSFRPSLSRFPHRVQNSCGVSRSSSRVLRPPLPDLAPRLPSLGSQHDATVSLRRRVLRPGLLVTRGRRPRSRVFQSTSTASITPSQVPKLFLPSTLISILSSPFSLLLPLPSLTSGSFPYSSSLPSLVPCSPLSVCTTSSGRRWVLRPKLLATCRRHLLSREMIIMMIMMIIIIMIVMI